jgi:hypothetical protein
MIQVGLIDDPGYFKQHKVEELLLHECLIFPDKFFSISTFAFGAVGSWTRYEKVIVSTARVFLVVFGSG